MAERRRFRALGQWQQGRRFAIKVGRQWRVRADQLAARCDWA